MKTKLILIFVLLTFFTTNTAQAQNDQKLLLGLEYSGIGMSWTNNNERKRGPYDMIGLNLQYNFGQRYSLLLGYARRKIGGFALDDQFQSMDVSALLKNEYMIGDEVTINPSFNVLSLGISLPTFNCKCIHQTLNYDFLWRQKVEMPASLTEISNTNRKLYRNIISGLRYSIQFKIAFPENNFRLYFGPTASLLSSTRFNDKTLSNFRMGATMGVQYLLKKNKAL